MVPKHATNCAWHVDQYPWECDCDMARTPFHVEAVKQLSEAGSCTCTRCVDSLAKSLAMAGAPNTPDHYWYRQGKDDGAQLERERIVAWLRRTLPSSIADLHDEADAIERGDHLA